MTRLGRFLHLPGPDRRLLIEAAIALIRSHIEVRTVGFTPIARRLGRHMDESPPDAESAALDAAARVRWAVETAARHLPSKPVCLPQAIAAKRMLERRRIPSTLYLGVDPARDLDAHAWVRVGQEIVTGGPTQERFAVVSTFT